MSTQIFKHVTAGGIHLEPMDFQRELAMEAYLIENKDVLTLDPKFLNSVEIIDTEMT